ncbi:MAG: radical SAM protein [Phycisphaerales bacterium]|nr:MAG: radical SAM protein [Phycisphaerales bacterium]
MVSSTQKKWRLFRAWSSRHPVWCTWQVTYRCDFRCGFCDYWKEVQGAEDEQTVEMFVEGSLKLAKLGSLLISLGGGEPFLRQDICDVVRAVALYHFPFVTTNGYHVTPELARDVFRAGLWGASVSIDYADAAKHDKRRGIKGAYERAVRALEWFSEARTYPWQRVNLMCVLLHDNLDQIEPLLRLAAERDAYFMIQPYGQRKTGSGRFVHGRDSVSRTLVDLHGKYQNFLSNRHFLSQFDQALNGGVPGCKAGTAFFNIDSAGDIAICVEERGGAVANLYRDPSAAIVQKLRAAARQNKCADCWYNCRGEVEMLYHPVAIFKSLPTLFFDTGRPSDKARSGLPVFGQ